MKWILAAFYDQNEKAREILQSAMKEFGTTVEKHVVTASDDLSTQMRNRSSKRASGARSEEERHCSATLGEGTREKNAKDTCDNDPALKSAAERDIEVEGSPTESLVQQEGKETQTTDPV